MVNRYGSMSEAEYDLMDRVIDKIQVTFGKLNFIEIGVCDGGTVRGVYRRCAEVNLPISSTGVDCLEHYKPTDLPDYTFLCGDSMDAWRQVEGRFNLLLIDGCHCVNHVISDFSNYSPFVIDGGYILLHDTAVPLNQYEQMPFPQDHSLAGKDPSKLGVREALKKLGLLDSRRTDFEFIEEIPSDSGVMGLMLYRRILPY